MVLSANCIPCSKHCPESRHQLVNAAVKRDKTGFLAVGSCSCCGRPVRQYVTVQDAQRLTLGDKGRLGDLRHGGTVRSKER